MHDNAVFSCCCTRSDCLKLQEFNACFKRVEHDAQLAAEIGQALLQEKNGELTYDLFKDDYSELKKLRWENEQLNEMVLLLKSELKSMATSTNELKNTLSIYERELQKKKLVEQLLEVKTDIEEELKIQVSDLKQELSQLRKSENNIISKFKRLNSNHETLQLTHEALSQEHDTLIRSYSSTKDLCSISKEKETLISENKYPTSVIPQSMPNRPTKKVPQFQMAVTNSNKNPFDVLHSVTLQTFDKINATDTRVLNRRLKRVFDISELSNMSNSIISGILVDLSEFRNQFEWVHDYDQDPNTEYFFPLVLAVQDLLKEVGTMKMTLNDLQADYVKRIEKQPLLTSYQLQHPSYVPLCHKSKDNSVRSAMDSEESKRGLMQGFLSLFTLH